MLTGRAVHGGDLWTVVQRRWDVDAWVVAVHGVHRLLAAATVQMQWLRAAWVAAASLGGRFEVGDRRSSVLTVKKYTFVCLVFNGTSTQAGLVNLCKQREGETDSVG